MRKVREVLRLKFELGLKNRQIARSCLIPHSSVANYLSRAKAAGLRWPLPEEVDDEALEGKLFPEGTRRPEGAAPVPDFASIHEELRRHRHVTLQLLWQEYKQEARRLAEQLGARHLLVETHELDDPRYAANPVNRC